MKPEKALLWIAIIAIIILRFLAKEHKWALITMGILILVLSIGFWITSGFWWGLGGFLVLTFLLIPRD